MVGTVRKGVRDAGRPAMTQGSDALPVVIVGAGLAGLACGLDLASSGVRIRILEAADAPGGRMRTDRRNGFLLDRGFQVFNTSYPQVKSRVQIRALQPRPFTPGALLATATGRVRFADPTRQPRDASDLLLGRLASMRDVISLGVMSATDMLAPARRIIAQPDRTTLIALSEAGISDELIELFFRPFLAGVFLEDRLETSARFFHLIWRSMLRGTLCLPRHGIGAVPAQLAAGLPPGAVSLGTAVAALTDDGVALADGTQIPARAVVVATGPAQAAALLPGLPVAHTRSVTTVYHATPRSPLREPTLLVDTGRIILNTVVLTEVTPSYSADGRALISSSVLGDASGREAEITTRLAELYQCDTSDWEHLATYPVVDALPAMPAPWSLTRPGRYGLQRYVCGDHRATGSVQGALASGTRAARELLADLA